MAPSSTHIIRKQVVELDLPEGSSTGSLQAKVAGLCRDLWPKIEALCDRYEAEGITFAFDRLELNLGELKAEKLTLEFGPRLLQQLETTLQHSLQAPPEPGQRPAGAPMLHTQSIPEALWTKPNAVQAYTAKADELALFFTFINTGQKPWWSSKVSIPSPKRWIEAVLETISQAQAKDYWQAWSKHPAAIRRLWQQFPQEQVLALLGRISPLPQWQQEVADLQRLVVQGQAQHALASPIPQQPGYVLRGYYLQRSAAPLAQLPVQVAVQGWQQLFGFTAPAKATVHLAQALAASPQLSESTLATWPQAFALPPQSSKTEATKTEDKDGSQASNTIPEVSPKASDGAHETEPATQSQRNRGKASSEDPNSPTQANPAAKSPDREVSKDGLTAQPANPDNLAPEKGRPEGRKVPAERAPSPDADQHSSQAPSQAAPPSQADATKPNVAETVKESAVPKRSEQAPSAAGESSAASTAEGTTIEHPDQGASADEGQTTLPVKETGSTRTAEGEGSASAPNPESTYSDAQDQTASTEDASGSQTLAPSPARKGDATKQGEEQNGERAARDQTDGAPLDTDQRSGQSSPQKPRSEAPHAEGSKAPVEEKQATEAASEGPNWPSESFLEKRTNTQDHPNQKSSIENRKSLDPADPAWRTRWEQFWTSQEKKTTPENDPPLWRKPHQTQIDGEWYVENGGLVLLWPFLSRFFSTLELVKEGTFVDEVAAERAVHILQFLVTAEEATPEYVLALNKYLCGLPLDHPVPAGITLSETEEKECNDLLEAAAKNWPALKNTSGEGFRKSFLSREAKLASEDGLWRLTVAPTGVDVLQNTRPWPVSIVKLPWMEESLYVAW